MALHDKDIPIDDNASSQKSIADIDEEAKIDDEVTEDPLTYHDDGGNVTDTEAGVKNNHPVQKCFCWLLHDELEKIAIGCQDQHHTDQLTCPEDLCVQQIFIIIMNNMLNLIKK